MARIVFFFVFVFTWTFFCGALIGAIPWEVFNLVRDTAFLGSDVLMGTSQMALSFLSAAVVMAPEDK
jgi:hypothetical protein